MNNIKKIPFFCFFLSFNLIAQEKLVQELQVPEDRLSSVDPAFNVIDPKNIPSDIDLEEKKDNLSLDEETVENDNSVAQTVDLSEEIIGIQGNWVKKRGWVKESYKVNDEIQETVSVIQKLHSPLQEKFVSIDGELDSFYKQEGFKQGEVSSLFNSLNKYLDKKRKKESKKIKQGVTDEEELKIELLLHDLKILKKEIEQLRLDIKSVDQLDKSLNDRLKKFDEYIKMALDESVKSKAMIDEIWYIIDDLKARDIYYQLKGDLLEKVKAIKKYLIGSFSSDFDNLLNLIRNQIQKIVDQTKDLEKKGLIIKNRSERLEKIKLDELKGQMTVEEIEKEEVIQEEENRFGRKIYNFFVSIVAKIYGFLSNL
ncbi:MAG: hypothetical protein ABIF12_03970 [bacterium]